MPAYDYTISVCYDSIENPYPDEPVINLTVDRESIALNETFRFSYEILYTKRMNDPIGVWYIYEWRNGEAEMVNSSMFGDHLSGEGSYTLTDPQVEKVVLEVLLGESYSRDADFWESREILVDSTASVTPTPTPSPTPDPTPGPTACPTADPTASPTANPTADPTAGPTAEPTAARP